MSDPRRMLDSEVSPHIRALLEAGRDAEPRSSLVETTLRSLRAAGLGAAPSGLSPLTAWTVVPGLAGVLVLGVVAGVIWTMKVSTPPLSPRPPTHGAPPTTPSKAERTEGAKTSSDPPSEPPAQVRTDPEGDADTGAAPRSSVAAPGRDRPTPRGMARPTTSAVPAAEGIGRERSRASTMAQRDLVLRARAALDGGAAQQALAILAGYESSFDELRFVPEVLSLRMQSHQRLGEVATADQLARRIIAAYPRSSQAGRARQLLRDRESRGGTN
ncbi:MAG: hypothetical protein JW751_14895 [Polyangiaceae bacterium]|nr:hypothetical protein [Polyangiaceae bacterium]